MEIRINKLTRALNQDTNDLRVAALCSLLNTDVNPNTKLTIAVYNGKGIHVDDEHELDIPELYQLQARIEDLIVRKQTIAALKTNIDKLKDLGIREISIDGYLISETIPPREHAVTAHSHFIEVEP